MKNTQEISGLTGISTGISVIYSLIGLIGYHSSLSTLNYYFGTGLVGSTMGEHDTGFVSLMNNFYSEVFHEYAFFGIYLALVLLIVSQIWEVSRENYTWKSLIGPVIMVMISFFFRHTRYISDISNYGLYLLYSTIIIGSVLYPLLVMKKNYKHIIITISLTCLLLILLYLGKKFF